MDARVARAWMLALLAHGLHGAWIASIAPCPMPQARLRRTPALAQPAPPARRRRTPALATRTTMSDFRFEDFEIWQLACDRGDELCALADALHEKNLYGFADQLRRAALSISNNIAEGSGSEHPKDFRNFLNISRRSVFECASMILFFHRKGLISAQTKETLVPQLAQLSRKIHNFKKTIS